VTAETYAAGDESEAASRRELSTFDVPPPEVEDGSGSSGVYRSVLAAVLDEAGPVGMLRIVTGDAEGQIFPLERAATTAGRGTDNDIVLLDLGVSRRHVVIHRHPEGFRLEDAQSGNGSFVNGAVVMESELFDGDFIRLGGTEMEFRTQGAPRLCQSVLAQSRAIQPHRVALLGLVTFCAAFATMLFVEWAGHTSAEGLAQAGITEWTKTAEAAADARRWRDAREALTVSRGFGPRSDHDALAVRIGRETDNARRFADLEREIEAKADIGTLDRLLASIDQGSVYRSEANLRARDAKKASIERTIDDAESDLAKGRSETARFKLEGVLQHEASHPRARKLLEELR
jgi:pSer/pThr/pTyr-binding forkhead associated (FHA) protein